MSSTRAGTNMVKKSPIYICYYSGNAGPELCVVLFFVFLINDRDDDKKEPFCKSAHSSRAMGLF